MNTPNTTTKKDPEEYHFINYRLTNLEKNLSEAIKKLETEQQNYNTQIMQTLQKLQEGQNQSHETISKLEQRTTELEKNLTCLDKLKDAASKNSERNKHTNHRIDVIQRILLIVGTAAITAFMTALFALLTK